ncbi:hypothetical protein [Bacillus sp. AFS055030]|uniref:hypothetical protein n=1 Tax=Bacillus sp. AFS055030 TaxID=2033507 RepID=UPI000BFC0FCD|nr:hypothetical protein [Bacillus sp. AFS055030]PGL70185.1 hypothetical protein CN925_12655 [Bacillus sp. AFS055030]
MLKIIKINAVDYIVFTAKESIAKSQLHIIEILSGTVPVGKQFSLLKEYLEENDFVLIKGATTFWCIDKVLKFDSSKKIKTLLQ